MRIHKQIFKSIAVLTLFSTMFVTGSFAQDTTTIVDPEINAPIIIATSPAGGETNVDLGSSIEITFSSDMDEESINGTTLQLHATYADTIHEDHKEVMLDDEMRDRSEIKETKNSWKYTTGVVSGTISYANKIAVFTPDGELKEATLYTFTVTTGVKDLDNIPLKNAQKWSFTTSGTSALKYNGIQNESDKYGMEETEERSMYAMSTKMYAMSSNKMKMIDLGKAGNFVILAKYYVNNESGSKIMGHIGEGALANNTKREKVRPQSTTGKDLELQSNQIDTASSNVTEAIQDMMSAYTDAALQYESDSTNYKDEQFDNTVLTPGVHEWSDILHITSDVTLSGGANDVWLFKTSKNLTVDENTTFTLTDGARAENIFWYVEGEVTIGKMAQFEGNILSMNEIKLEKGAKLNGRMYSQTSITLDDNTVTEPRSMSAQTTSTNR